jgi:hypothetical protein
MNEFDELLQSEEPIKKKASAKKQKQKEAQKKKKQAKTSKLFKWGMISAVVILSITTIFFGLMYAGTNIQLEELSKRSGVKTIDKTEQALEVYRKVADAGDQQDIKESQILNLKQQLKTTLEQAEKAKQAGSNQQKFIASVLSESQATDVISKFFKLYFGQDGNTSVKGNKDLVKLFGTEQEMLSLDNLESPMKELSSAGELATVPTVLFSGMRGTVNDYFVIAGFKVKDKIVPQVYRMSIDLNSKIKVVHYLGALDVNYDEIVKTLDEVKSNDKEKPTTTTVTTTTETTTTQAKTKSSN